MANILRARVATLGCVVLWACGGITTDGDASVDGSSGDGGSLDACIAADDAYVICNGNQGCFPPTAQGAHSACENCLSGPNTPSQPGLCISATTSVPQGIATDGQLYVVAEPAAPNAWDPFPFEVGELFANNGGAPQVRYADWKPWSGAPLPSPTTCPTFVNFRICGGNCGSCNTNETCTGRSPDHPWGLCVPTLAGCDNNGADGGWIGCEAGTTCLAFQTSTDGQPIADKHGFCFSGSACQEAQANYAGGVVCNGQ